MNKKTLYIWTLVALLAPVKALAVCPVCAIGVVAGLGLAEYFHVDDTISGLWIGGLLVASIYLTINWLEKKKIKFKFRIILTTIVFYASIIWPLYSLGYIGHVNHQLWGIDKLLLSVTIGSLGFLGGAVAYKKIKAKNGKAHFPFQKVVMPIAPLVILSLVFYLITRGAL